MESKQALRVVIASPGDVAQERDAVEAVLRRVERGVGRDRKLVFDIGRWETDVYAGFHLEGGQGICDEVLQIAQADIVIAILWARIGAPREDGKTNTQHEIEQAIEAWGKKERPMPMLFFRDEPPPENTVAVARQWTAVREYRELADRRDSTFRGLVVDYTDLGSFKDKLLDTMQAYLHKLLPAPAGSPEIAEPQVDVTPWLEGVVRTCSHIDLRGFKVGSRQANRFPVEDLYVPLTMAWHATESGTNIDPRTEQSVRLEEALKHPRVTIVGAPGAGKTTFLWRIAKALATARLGNNPVTAEDLLAFEEPLYPLFIKVGELAEYRAKCEKNGGGPSTQESPAWIPNFLAAKSVDEKWGLNQAFFEALLKDGNAILLLDGLDEAPSRIERERVATIFENCLGVYGKSRCVVTVRPKAYEAIRKLKDFAEVSVAPFDRNAVELFLKKWCSALFGDDKVRAEQYRLQLRDALDARIEIRSMASNPMMLTALAALYWHDKRLPGQRAELYESILSYLVRSRERRPGRVSDKIGLRRLARLALAMAAHPEGRPVRVRRDWAAEVIADEFSGKTRADQVDQAEAFLIEEEIDSGVFMSEGREVRFWHLTFQEYLAAKAIGGLSEEDQVQMLFHKDRLYSPEWRETVLLFAGVLSGQGKDVDLLVGAMLAKLSPEASLTEKARCVGLIGAITRDLDSVGYSPRNEYSHDLLNEVKAIFDPEKAPKIPIQTRVDAADALAQFGDDRFADDEALWVTIPGGKFWMGAQNADPNGRNYDPDAWDWEGPVREVEVKAFQIRRFPVTVGEYEKFIDADGYFDRRWWMEGFGEQIEPFGWASQRAYKTRPVMVDAFEAQAFCAWKGWRLPIEEEWEFAARGPEARPYPWGNEPPDETRAIGPHSIAGITPVGLFPSGRTPLGVEDLAGNAWEYCGNRFDPEDVDHRLAIDPEALALRGGKRCSARNKDEPELQGSPYAFRCVRDVPGPKDLRAGSLSWEGAPRLSAP